MLCLRYFTELVYVKRRKLSIGFKRPLCSQSFSTAKALFTVYICVSMHTYAYSGCVRAFSLRAMNSRQQQISAVQIIQQQKQQQ